MRRKVVILLVTVLYFLQATPVAAIKADAEILKQLNVDSRAVFLQDINRDKVILQQKSTEILPVASLTKIMTALVVLEKRNLSDRVLITPEMVNGLGDYVAIGLHVGQQVSVEDLLYATLLPSAGDAAQALAISTSGSISDFVKIMNQKADQLGLKNTHFSNPVGMNENNYSTAQDMAVVLRAALKNKTFATIFQTYEHYLPSANLTAIKTFKKHASFIGGKTGYTQLAGRCLASNANINGDDYIMITLGANPNSSNHLHDADKIYDYVKQTYIKRVILKKGDPIATVSVTDSKQKTLDLVAEQGAQVILHKDIPLSQLDYRYIGIQEITPDIELGSQLGTFAIYDGDEKLYETNVYLRDEIEFYDYPLIIASFIGIGILSASLILIIIMLVHSRVKR